MTPRVLTTIPADLVLGYGPRVVARVTETIPLPDRGLVLLVGRNGAGKSTLMKFLTNGLGGGQRPSGLPSTAYLPEELRFHDELSLNAFAGAVLPRRDRSRMIEVATALELDPRRPFGELSRGNRQKFRIAATLGLGAAKAVELLVLDEPLSGLDFAIRRLAWNVIAEECSRRTVMVSLHCEAAPFPPKLVLVATDGEIRALPEPLSSWADLEQALLPPSQPVPALPEAIPA